jgi:SAM-dependent methyltransferase
MKKHEYLHMFEEEEGHWWYMGMRAVVRSLVPPASLPESPCLLDAGCGTGYTMGWLRIHYGAVITGFDYYPQGLAFCRRRGEHQLVQADAARLPFSQDIFDLVTAFDVVSHLATDNSRALALSEFLRVLKPRGRLLMRVPAYEWLKSSHDDDVMTYRRYGKRELRAALARAGFRPLSLTYANTILFPAAVCWRMLKKAGLAPAGSDVRPGTRGSKWMNRALLAVLKTEAALLRRGHFRFPFGLSLFAVAGKPDM